MKTLLRLTPIFILFVALAPPTAAYKPDWQATAAAIPAAVETHLAPTIAAIRVREHNLFNTMRATYQARYPTPTPYVRPTFTPQPVSAQTTPITLRQTWNVRLLDVQWEYDDVVRTAGYRTYSLLTGEQWVAVKLEITNIGCSYAGYRFPRPFSIGLALRTLDHRLIRFAVPQAPLRTHAQTLASYKANGISDGTEQAYPQLPIEYHKLPYLFHPNVPTQGWIVWAVRTADLPGLQLGLATGDGGYQWWRLDNDAATAAA